MPGNIFDAMDRFLKNQKQDTTTQGTIVNIAGTTALVKISGSDRVQEAWYNKGANLAPGDHCIMQRTSGNAKWVVMGGFGTQLSGINEQTVATAPGVSGNAESVAAYTNASNGSTMPNTSVGGKATPTTIHSVGITTTKNVSHILAGFAGFYGGAEEVGYDSYIILRVLIGGVIVATTRSEFAVAQAPSPGGAYSNLSTVGLRRSVAKGFYNVELQIVTPYTSAAFAYMNDGQLFAVEI